MGCLLLAVRLVASPHSSQKVKQGTWFSLEMWIAMVEKLLLLLNDETLCQKLGAAGQDLVRRNYNIEGNLRHLFSLYNALLNGTISCTEKPSLIEP